MRLVVVGGAPGTGKTTLAGGVADRLGFVTINSDRVRKELAGLDPERSAPDTFGAGLYTPEWSSSSVMPSVTAATRRSSFLAHGWRPTERWP